MPEEVPLVPPRPVGKMADTTVMTTLDRLLRNGLPGGTRRSRALVCSALASREHLEDTSPSDVVPGLLANAAAPAAETAWLRIRFATEGLIRLLPWGGIFRPGVLECRPCS